jgi:hypothetical protein
MKGPTLFNQFLNSVTILEKASEPDHLRRMCEVRQVLSTASELILELQVKLDFERARVADLMEARTIPNSVIYNLEKITQKQGKQEKVSMGFDYLL